MTETAERLNNQAIVLASDGSFKEAIACFVRALTIEKDNAILWYNLGLTYRDAGDFLRAHDSLKNALKISPENTEIIEELALILYNHGFLEEALEYCASGLSIDSDNFHLWNTKGVILFNKKEYEKASYAFENAVILNPYYYDALFNLRDAYKKLNNKIGEQECSIRLRELKKNGEPF